jgi:predicted dehydrogenase
MMAVTLADDYGLSKAAATQQIGAPDLPYLPLHPATYNPPIGLIGCGSIAAQQLDAYRHAGYRVVAFCDHSESKARAYQTRFYPDAFVTTDYRELLRHADIEVVDIATHAEQHAALIEAALRAGKHVLSQKPFLLDLEDGYRLRPIAG